MYDMDLAEACVQYDLSWSLCTISISESPLLQYLILGELQSQLL